MEDCKEKEGATAKTLGRTKPTTVQTENTVATSSTPLYELVNLMSSFSKPAAGVSEIVTAKTTPTPNVPKPTHSQVPPTDTSTSDEAYKQFMHNLQNLDSATLDIFIDEIVKVRAKPLTNPSEVPTTPFVALEDKSVEQGQKGLGDNGVGIGGNESKAIEGVFAGDGETEFAGRE